MEKIILYVDDADFASTQLAQRMAASGGAVAGPRHWIVVACAPRMTHRVSKWVSRSARENWRGRWFTKTMERLEPVLRAGGDEVTAQLAKSPLVEFTRQLRLQHGATLVVDARRPRIGVDLEAVDKNTVPAGQSGWALPGAVAGMGALLVLTSELGE